MLSLTHHRLCQLLIQRGFAQKNPPLHVPLPIPQPPENSQQAQTSQPPESPQQLPISQPPEIPQQAQTCQQPENFHDTPKSPHEGQQDDIPHSPVDPTPTSPHLAESTLPTISVPSDDSLTPPPSPSCKKKRTPTVSVSRPRTRSTTQILTSSEKPLPRKEPSSLKKRKGSGFTAFLPRRKRKMAIETGLTSSSPDPATILLKPLSPSQIPQTASTEDTVTQEPVSRDNTTSFMDYEVTATQEPVTYLVAETQEPATTVQEYTKHDDSGRPAVAETQEPATTGHQQTTPTESTSA